MWRRCRRAEVPAEQLAGPSTARRTDGAGAVGEEDGGAAVVPVGDAARVSAPMSRMRDRPMAMSAVGGDEPYTKPEQAALRSKAPHRQPELVLDGEAVAGTGPGRGVVVAQDQQVDSAGSTPARSRAAPGLDGEAGGGAADAALADAGALDDPLVAGVERGLEVVRW
jgi:hypothetical protein